MKKEKAFLEKTREKLASKFAAVSAQEKVQEEAILIPPSSHVEFTFDTPANMRNFNCDSEQHNKMVETRRSEVSKPFSAYEEHEFNVKTAEMRWLAAKKMEEAARAAEAIALAEIKALSGTERSYEFALPEPRKVTFALAENIPRNPKAMMIPEEPTLKKLEEASEEIVHSKQVLTDALNRIETANRKQHAAKEALRKWIPEVDLKEKTMYHSFNFNKFNQAGFRQDSSLPDVTRSTIANNNPKPVSRPTTSMRDVLSRKQVPEGYAERKEMEEHTERRKVALSQMLRALREDLTLSPKTEKDHESDQKPTVTPKKKFGFIHISLPMARPRYGGLTIG
ncbi:hypothetical protein TSUD_133690 [Trifolium subterraneum]|uniref:WEB family protein n=1 Tax=Trifolium subterraneum TaxID=3900 RepID=A0A2Z6NYA0_TRISU|nr:hypothetical protein TSUD_133690 [Trifolium subterraneum]